MCTFVGGWLEWTELINEAIYRKAAWNLVLKEMMDAGWAEGMEGLNKLSTLIFKGSTRKYIFIQLKAYSLLKWAFSLI